jgi:TRAP-type C4-dicarboxylate transport system permease small subunit
LNRLIHKITKGFAYVSAAIFLVIVLIVLANIVGRAVFNKPIKGTVEIVQYGVMFCGIVMCGRTGGAPHQRHIPDRQVPEALPGRSRRAGEAPGRGGVRHPLGDLHRQYLRGGGIGKIDGYLPDAV